MMNIADTIDQDISTVQRIPAGGVLDVIKSYRRHLPLFFLTAGLIFLAVALYTWTRTARYTAVTTVEITPRKAEVGSDRSAPVSDPTADASVDTQVEMLRNPDLAGIVVDRLGLADNPAFDRLTRAPGLLERLGFGSGTPREALTRTQRRAAAVDTVEQDLDVRRVAQTFILEVSVTTLDQALTSRIANALASSYVQQSLDMKLSPGGNANKLLGVQLSRAQADVISAESAMNSYKVAHNLMTVGGGTLAEEELTNLDVQVAEAQAAESEAQARSSTARRQLALGSNGEDVGEALGSPVVQELRRQRAEVERKLAELSNTFGPKYPATSAAQRELTSIDAQIHSEVKRIISSLDAQSQVASRRAGSLMANRNETRGAVAGNNVASVRLNELQFRAKAARDLYEELLGRVREISTQSATTLPDARVASIAGMPKRPSSPNVPINLLVGLLLGMAGGVAAVVIRQGIDQGLSSLEDVESRLNLPYLAGLPTLASSVGKPHDDDPAAAIINHRRSAFAEAYRSLAAAVLEGRPGTRTILVTSAVPNEGKTTTAICLARVIALSGRRVLLVDADLRRPSVASNLGLVATAGVHEVLTGKASFEDALIHDPETGAHILPVLDAASMETSPIEGGQFAELIQRLSAQYDAVILDGSPILPVVDGRVLAKAVDAVIFLVRWRKTPATAVEMAMHLLSTVGASVAGVALSRVDLHAMAKSGYGDPAKYFKLYENYYHS